MVRKVAEKAVMPVVRINDATFSDLSALKTWFGTKTPSETIDRVVREAMERLDLKRDGKPNALVAYTADEPVCVDGTFGLAFTKPLNAWIDGQALDNPNWLSILLMIIVKIKVRGFHGKDLIKELRIATKVGRYNESGFGYYPDLGISVQRRSAQECWKEVDRLAKRWHIPVRVEFRWRESTKAQHPGKISVLHSGCE